MPLERGFLSLIEKAIAEDIKLEEFENMFPDDPSKKASLMQKIRPDAPIALAPDVSGAVCCR